jgi:hypothetical protein
MVLARSLSSGYRERLAALAVGPRLQGLAQLLCGLAELGAMLLVELTASGQRFSKLDKNVR